MPSFAGGIILVISCLSVECLSTAVKILRHEKQHLEEKPASYYLTLILLYVSILKKLKTYTDCCQEKSVWLVHGFVQFVILCNAFDAR